MAESSNLFLAVGMVITGSINTLVVKLADVTDSVGIDGSSSAFNHPFVQALGMFIGEFSCLLVYWYKNCQKGADAQKKTFSPWVFFIPAMCDMTATSIMYIGLSLTYASVYQMLRGSVVIFTGIFSVVFLKRRLQSFHWVGMVLVLIGLAFVGLSSVVGSSSDDSAPDPILGDILVVAAQLIVATQMVVEEKFVAKYDVEPLYAVGLEGLFGIYGVSVILLVSYYIPGSSGGNHAESMPDALVQMYNSWIILLSTVGMIFSISFFNYFGLTVTKKISATTRMVLDSVRTFVIWGFSLAVGWQEFQYWQIVGFVFLLLGTFVYNNIIKLPWLKQQETDKELRQIQEAEEHLPDAIMEEPLINGNDVRNNSSDNQIQY